MLVYPTTIVAVVLVATVVGDEGNGNKEGGSSDGHVGITSVQSISTHEFLNSLPKYPFIDLLKFTDKSYDEAFNYLDSNEDHLITSDDLKIHYYHKDFEFTIQKFMKLLDKPDSNSHDSIDLEEFKSFMNRDQVKRKTFMGTSLPSAEYRQRFFADAILTYVYLVLDKDAIRKLFDSLQSNKDEQLDYNEVKGMEVKMMNGNEQNELTDAQVTVIMAEMGGSTGAISFEDFENYLQGGDLAFMFRECRIKLNNGVAEYDNLCLVRKMIRYTTRSLTEYMITLLFDSLDSKPKDRILLIRDYKEAFNCDYSKAEHIFAIIGGSYGDFRYMLQSPILNAFYESECSTEKETDIKLDGRIECIKRKLWDVLNTKFSPIYAGIPDLDLISIFEDLDTTNDGKIEQKLDLEDGKRWQTELARKFMEEVGHPETKANVKLEDFMQYMNGPYMLNALAECQLEKDKITCYNRELKDVITHVLTDSEVRDFFSFYTNKKQSPSTTTTDPNQENNQESTKEVISKTSLREMYPNMPEDVMDTFLIELGMGDRYVYPIEFKFYVKQQEPSHVFSIDDKSVPRKHFALDQLHGKLIFYLESFMTVHDIYRLFIQLDKNANGVIDIRDVREQKKILDTKLLANMAVYGNKEHATHQEFWLFLNSKASGKEETRKRLLEKECAKLNQKKELNCFASKLKSVK